MPNILMVVTAADSIALADGTDHATGFWAEELVVAHRDLVAAGHSVTVATPGGRPAPVDPGSLTAEGVGDADRAADYAAYLDRIAPALAAPAVLADLSATDFAAIVLPGGHGPMVDLAFDADLGRLLVDADREGRLIAPFCHGPAGLLAATRPDGSFAFAGRRLSVFSDAEERAGGLGEATPWWVEATLAERGAVIDDGEPWSSHVVRDGTLISGQNPQSSAAVTAELVAALAATAAA
ncbi:type 1 glutamine amidotransferase domain-containing protein [Agromyces sp. CFH 90414]|uniref:Type 1 glutamine amidotransferase domain-containing protein n=1 Tax=Agromyces agglutinans TaxID=2662258 RepID=A0A6I2FBN9_9MICO|nr:type 1 glutamine amidotransferase domain-containing protein [Agromyces agglutinans]MRG61227.1 type 1 glutamine amidotransferase domain-containing protein [Agromyces agglutinans]